MDAAALDVVRGLESEMKCDYHCAAGNEINGKIE